jgi:PAS domain S-box-containing protein
MVEDIRTQFEAEIQELHQRVQDLERTLARTSAAEANWRALLNSAPDFVLIINPDGSIRFLNRAVPADQLKKVLGTCAYEYVLPEYQEAVREYVDEVLETGVIRHVEIPAWDAERKDKSWYSVRLGPFKEHDRITGVTCIATDITERRKAERTRQEVEQRLHTLCSISPVGIMRFDVDGKCVYVNRRCCDITGRSTWELLGEGWSNSIDPNDRERVLQHWYEDNAADAPHRLEYRIVQPDGSIRWVYAQTIAEIDRHDKTIGYVGTITDITERKQQEEKLRSEERLLRKLLDLQERERKLVAHDIHDGFVQDVVGAKMMLEAASEELAKQGAKEKTIKQAVEHLSLAIREARRMIGELRPLIIDEQGIIEAIQYLVHDERFCQGVKVAFKHDVTFERLNPMLEGTLFRIVQEALTNVVRHSQSPTATVSLTEADGFLQLEIRDEGIGCNTENVPEDRFGLRGIRERARLFSGAAQITSAPGQGTRIFVEMPWTAAS